MKKFILAAAAFAISTTAALAQSPEVTVNFTMNSEMKSLKNKDARDTFKIGIEDRSVDTDLTLDCQAGSTSFIIVRKARACKVTGDGFIISPDGKQRKKRTEYLGGLVTEADGTTDGSNIKINYLTSGGGAAQNSAFGGSLNLKPELTSTGAAALKDKVLQKLEGGAGDLIDQRVDTIDFNKFATPSAGFPSDKGCVWSGSMIYAYQTESWYIDVSALCRQKDDSVKEYKLKGNMPYSADTGPEGEAQYTLSLALPNANALSDEALFSGGTADEDLFAKVDGIEGVINMKEGNNVTIKVDGADEEVPSTVDATGTFTGTNVPLDVVRSLVTIFALNASGIFGG